MRILVHVTQQGHRQQDTLEALSQGWDSSRPFMKAVIKHRVSKMRRKMTFRKESGDNFYNFTGNAISLKGTRFFLVYLKKICGFL